ncbi:DPP IV N-terminal domain-containing protein [bacterium]|nr:DPP IV N-terminal domain-containing protein [bacterium]
MNLQKNCLFLLIPLILWGSCKAPQKREITKKDYKRAESFLPRNLEKKAYNLKVSPHWIMESSSFWYKVNTKEGKKFWKVDPEEKVKKPAFDHKKLAKALSRKTGETYTYKDLPFDTIEFVEKYKIKFKVDDQTWIADLKDYTLKQKEKKKEKEEKLSPDGKWVAFSKDYNLFIRSKKTGQEIQLTTKGQKLYEYASSLKWGDLIEGENGKIPSRFMIKWSPDSKKIYTHILDLREAKKLYLLKSADKEGYRAKLFSYYRALPGEKNSGRLIPVIINVETQKEVKIDLEPIPRFLGLDIHWFKNSRKLHARKYDRGYKAVNLLEINAQTGEVKNAIKDENKTYVENSLCEYKFLEESGKTFLTSERDGWNHIYLYDWNKGELIRQITEGKFVVLDIVYADKEKENIFFTAVGREKNRDPYLVHLYRVGFDGSDLKLLTPEHAYHEMNSSPNHKYFVDNYSRVDSPPQSVLRKLEDGSIHMKLEEADVKDVMALGWDSPEPFKVKAADGKTDIYGLIWKPSNFDPTKKYPVIDQTYTGPQAVNTPKTFTRALFHSNTSLVELGFIAITVDGRGTAHRSKEFHNFSYHNLGGGCTDHITAIKKLSKEHDYMDTERVGIYGHSAGGYDAAHALLKWPDFYKVGVSSSGNHHHRMAKAWWPEMYMGYPVEKYYKEQSNINMAKNLKGNLLLVHGDMDENVNPASTIRLAHALIKNKKDFDLLILPNNHHGYKGVFKDYFIRKRWDYFVEHLHSIQPPSYTLTTPKKE